MTIHHDKMAYGRLASSREDLSEDKLLRMLGGLNSRPVRVALCAKKLATDGVSVIRQTLGELAGTAELAVFGEFLPCPKMRCDFNVRGAEFADCIHGLDAIAEAAISCSVAVAFGYSSGVDAEKRAGLAVVDNYGRVVAVCNEIGRNTDGRAEKCAEVFTLCGKKFVAAFGGAPWDDNLLKNISSVGADAFIWGIYDGISAQDSYRTGMRGYAARAKFAAGSLLILNGGDGEAACFKRGDEMYSSFVGGSGVVIDEI